ncbi:MAG: hypothetical protein HKN24_01690 [Acidimicrobiales bacterium]|nr:hypothetical protein [Acidimicrobiales bacterium]
MKRVLAGIAVGLIGVVAFVYTTDSLSFTWPWDIVPEINEVQVELTLPEEARIVNIEPIMLDCRARVHAEVPVLGRREHALFDQVYRTDTIEMVAIGDVDTCVDGGAAKVLRRSDGTTEIVIPAESIKFVRPRVNTVETAASVTVDKGLLGKVTDVFPWVSDDLALTPTAYAYSQNVIGSSECMRTAYTVTRGLITDAYRQQFIDQGADAGKLSVRIDGEPVFEDPEPIYMGEGVEMSVGNGSVTCVADRDLS